MTTTRAVEVHDLTVASARSGYSVVEGINLQIDRGQILGLVGESGSGKSTVGVALLGKARKGLKIKSGTVHIGPADILKLDAKGLQRVRGRVVSYVAQDPTSGLNPSLRIGTQLREALLVHRDRDPSLNIDERVLELLDEVALPQTPELLRKFPHQLSGGQQQRVCIAMAYAWRPDLVVLDEPTTGLDVTTQRTILDTVRNLSTSFGVSALYVSHDLPVVAQIADETAVMYAGRLVERNRGTALFTTPRHPYTAGLIAAAPSPDQSNHLVGIEGRPPRPGHWPVGCAFADRCSNAIERCRTTLPEWVEDDGAGLRCWNPIAGSSVQRPALRVVAAEESVEPLALRVAGLSATYGGNPVLSNVSVDVSRGSCTAVVGESGSGKTTLARCIVGLHTSASGELELAGRPLPFGFANRADAERRLVQYVFQNPFASLNPRMSVSENIAEPLRHFEKLGRSERRQRVLDVLDRVALSSSFADRMPDQLSGGERQRVAVGRALVVNPELLICDEVTSALDVSVQALLVEQLRELQESAGLSMLFITHNLAVVRSIADNVVVLARGRVREAGTADQVLDHPSDEYTKQLLADLPRLEASTSAAGHDQAG